MDTFGHISFVAPAGVAWLTMFACAGVLIAGQYRVHRRAWRTGYKQCDLKWKRLFTDYEIASRLAMLEESTEPDNEPPPESYSEAKIGDPIPHVEVNSRLFAISINPLRVKITRLVEKHREMVLTVHATRHLSSNLREALAKWDAIAFKE